MRPSDILRSSSFRYAFGLTAMFLAAYLLSGFFALRSIQSELQNSITDTVELSAERFEDVYETQGRAGVIAQAKTELLALDADERFIWLGTKQGETIVGRPFKIANIAVPGRVSGRTLGLEDDEPFQITVRDMGELKLIIGKNYEQSDEMEAVILGAFGGIPLLLITLSLLTSILLARKSQRRVAAIAQTADAVSQGNLKARISVDTDNDDLDRLAIHLNQSFARLEDTVESIRQVSVDIAHDLRTPISRLGIRLEQLLGDVESDSEMEKRLQAATSDIKNINTTFDSLLRIAQIEAGARKSRFREVSLSDIASALFEAYTPVAEENEQSLTLNDHYPGSTSVWGDKQLLTQAIANVIENAMKHCPKGAQIALELTGSDGKIAVKISDNGPGIPDSERPNVVKRFYRLDKSRLTPGSGLGLSLVKAIADLHGAKFLLDNNKPGLIVSLIFAPHGSN